MCVDTTPPLSGRVRVYFRVLWAALLGWPIIARVRFKGGITISRGVKNLLVIGNTIHGDGTTQVGIRVEQGLMSPKQSLLERLGMEP